MYVTLKAEGQRAWVLKAWDTSNNKQEIIEIKFFDVTLSQEFAAKFHKIFPAHPQRQRPPPVPKHIQQQQYHHPPQVQPNYVHQGTNRTNDICNLNEMNG